MPKLATPRVPSYRRHKPTGQAVVTINGRDIYLGKWNSAASKDEYDRLIAEFLANGRRLQSDAGTTVVEVLNAYRKFAENYYRKDGRVTSEYGCILESLKIVRELYGRKIANDFGPLALKAVRQRMVDKGWSRGHINKAIGRIRRCFKWAVENELVRRDLYHGLMAVSGLRKGRSEAREPDPVMPVDDATVQATLPHLTSVVAAMVRFQRITGCRPQDVCNLRPCDVDMSGEVWLYRPSTHCWGAVHSPQLPPSHPPGVRYCLSRNRTALSPRRRKPSAMARSTDGQAASRTRPVAIRPPLVSESPASLRRHRDSQTVRVGRRPSHLGARIG